MNYTIHVECDERDGPRLEAYIRQYCQSMIAGVDYAIQGGPVGDPLPKKSVPSSDEPSVKQQKLFDWKLGVLRNLMQQARQIVDFDEVTLNFARDVEYVAGIERREGTITKQRMGQLIDAVLDACTDMEIGLANAD